MNSSDEIVSTKCKAE